MGLATKRLIGVAGRPLEKNDDLTCDLPQPIAMHILQSLVHNATLSVSILPWIESIVGLCIDSFAHPHWSIRNAALQVSSVKRNRQFVTLFQFNCFFVLFFLLIVSVVRIGNSSSGGADEESRRPLWIAHFSRVVP